MSAIGQPVSRVDGRLKVTGAARYAADIPITDLAHGAIVHSTVANGRTAAIDTANAISSAMGQASMLLASSSR